MSTLPKQEHLSPDASSKDASRGARGYELSARDRAVAWTSFVMALLQSICGAVVAIDGMRLAIGLGSLAFGSGAGALLARFHADWIRLPMVGLALLGSLVNLAILWHVRHLRKRPASQWRQRTLTRREVRMERAQWILSCLTLLLIGYEEYLHVGFHHTL